MNLKLMIKRMIQGIVGVVFLFGTSSFVTAQNKDKTKDKAPKQEKKAVLPSPPPQQVYAQQQTQNQKRYDQRTQTYQQGQQTWNVQKQQIQQQVVIKTQDKNAKNVIRDQNVLRTQEQLRVLNQQNQQNQAAIQQRKATEKELKTITDRQMQWHQSEQTWQNNYNSRWQNQQNVFSQRENLLRQQKRNQQLAFHQAYWERVREDQLRLQSWTFYDDVGLQYGYSRGGRTYYTSQYGMNLIRDAVNDGYQQGFLAGQADREDGWRSDYKNALAYEDATYGYNGYWIALDEYQYYFRQGFQRGYQDGYNGRYQYGAYDNNNGIFALLGNILNGIVNFAVIVD